jgi:hypothetical protein
MFLSFFQTLKHSVVKTLSLPETANGLSVNGIWAPGSINIGLQRRTKLVKKIFLQQINAGKKRFDALLPVRRAAASGSIS